MSGLASHWCKLEAFGAEESDSEIASLVSVCRLDRERESNYSSDLEKLYEDSWLEASNGVVETELPAASSEVQTAAGSENCSKKEQQSK